MSRRIRWPNRCMRPSSWAWREAREGEEVRREGVEGRMRGAVAVSGSERSEAVRVVGSSVGG